MSSERAGGSDGPDHFQLWNLFRDFKLRGPKQPEGKRRRQSVTAFKRIACGSRSKGTTSLQSRVICGGILHPWLVRKARL